MNVVMYGMDQLEQVQKEREAAFYAFLFHKVAGPNLNNEVYFTRFLVNQFTTFPIAKGYPIIARKCKQPKCYFYVNVEQARDLDHSFFRFLNRQVEYLRCSCGNIIKEIEEFIYDSPLAGFLQLKLSQLDYSMLKNIQITKNHEVYLENKGPFQEAFNCARLSAITQVGNTFRSEKQKQQQNQVQAVKESKTLQVNSCSIMNQIQQRICDLHMFKGQFKPGQEIWKDNVKQKNILPIVSVKSAKPFVYLYKQISEQHKLITIPLQVKAELGEKHLEYYDYDLLTYYYLNTNGVLLYCDFRFMYNFTSNTYQLTQLCTIEDLPKIESLIKDHSKLIIKNGKIYFFCAIVENPQFIHIFNALLPQEGSRPVKMQSVLKDRAHYRRGFSVTWIRAGLLIKQECIIIFGGIIEKMKNFKLLEIMALSPQEDKYLYHMVSVNEEDFSKVSLLFANISIFASKLMMIGGYDAGTQKYNKNILFLHLKEGKRVTVQPITAGDSGKEEVGDRGAVEAVHISEGTLIYGRLGKQIKPTILKLRNQKGGVEIQNIKLS